MPVRVKPWIVWSWDELGVEPSLGTFFLAQCPARQHQDEGAMIPQASSAGTQQ